jgi:heptosyltransferase-2
VVADIQRLVVRAPNWLGDAVMALPAMAAFRRNLPGTLIVAANAAIVSLFREGTDVRPDEIVEVDPSREVEQLRSTNADVILLLPNSFRSAWIARQSRIAGRWGYKNAGRGLLLTRSAARPRGPLHHVQYYLQLVRALDIEAPDDVPVLRPRQATLDRADALLRDAGVDSGRRIAGLAPGAAYGHAKRWPPDRVAQLMTELAARDVVPVLVGAAADRETARAIESALPRDVRAVNLIGRTTLRDLIGVLARCQVFVSNDSGAMHVASAIGVPLTAIFGPTDERATAPQGPGVRDIIVRDTFCRPCMLRECPIDHRCMKRITVSAVLESVEKNLARGATGSLPRP